MISPPETVSPAKTFTPSIFGFDGPILRSLSSPEVDTDGVVARFPEPGSRDALCALIDRDVVSADELEDRLRLTFSRNAILTLPLRHEASMPEVVELVPTRDGRLDVAGIVVWENLNPTR